MTQKDKRKIIEQIEGAFKPFRCVVQTTKPRNDLELIDNFNFILFDQDFSCIIKKDAITFKHVSHLHYLEVNIQNWRYEVRKKGKILDKYPLDEE